MNQGRSDDQGCLEWYLRGVVSKDGMLGIGVSRVAMDGYSWGRLVNGI